MIDRHLAALLSIGVLLLAGCNAERPSAKVADAEGAGASTDFDKVATPPAADPARPRSPETGDAVASQTTGDADLAERAGTRAPRAAETKGRTAPKKNAATEVAEEEAIEPRKSLAGNWEFVLCDFGADILGLLLKVEQDGDEYRVSLLDDSQSMSGWTIDNSRLSERTADIQFKSHDGGTVDFKGQLQDDGIVRGNVRFGTEGLELVRWMPSRRKSLEGAKPMISSIGAEKMQGFQPDPENPLAGLREKARDLGKTSLAYELYRRLSAVFRGQRPDAEAYAGFPDEYLAAAEPWGQRVVARAHLDVAYTMALCGYDTTRAREHLTAAEQQFGDDGTPGQLKRRDIARGLIFLQSDDADEQQSGRDLLAEVRSEDPFNTEATLGLAAYFERSDQPEEALELYGELAALPTGAGDMGPVVRLWEELGRAPEALDAYLDEIYKRQVHKFAEPSSAAPRAEGRQQTVLGELFTGGSCPPCVAADIATGGLEITYPTSDLIMLRYHQHVPGPDPLTIPQGEDRAASYYRIQGTPSLFFNGQPVETVMSMYGGFENAATGYADLRQIVDSLLTQSSDITISLTASGADGSVTIKADVAGPEELPETWRLRICLADDEVAYPARNGIRLHEMVVRAMPGGEEGTAPEDGRLRFEDTLSLESVREEIREYVAQIRGLPEPPLDLQNLHVVAFVQDDSDHKVLQATAVPLTVRGGAASDEQTSEPAEEQPAASSSTNE